MSVSLYIRLLHDISKRTGHHHRHNHLCIFAYTNKNMQYSLLPYY